jgi:hypothetical protein
MKMIAQHAILLGARSGGKARFLAMFDDHVIGIIDRRAIGQIRRWQLHRIPGPRCIEPDV